MGDSGCVIAHKSEPGSLLNVAFEVTNMVPPMSNTTRPCRHSYQDANFTSVTQMVMAACTRSCCLKLLASEVAPGCTTICLGVVRPVERGACDTTILEASSVSVGPTDRLTRPPLSVTSSPSSVSLAWLATEALDSLFQVHLLLSCFHLVNCLAKIFPFN